MGQDLDQISHFPGDGLSAIGEDLGLFAERASPVLLTTARVFIDKQIDIWARVMKDNGIKADGAPGATINRKGPAGLFFIAGLGSAIANNVFSVKQTFMLN